MDCRTGLEALPKTRRIACERTVCLRARAWLDLAKGRLLTMKGEGEGKMAGEFLQDGETIKLDGRFRLSMEAEQTFER